MKKIIFFLLIIVVIMYMYTGRYQVTTQNISERGYTALFDEPHWIVRTVNESINKGIRFVNEWIDQREIK